MAKHRNDKPTFVDHPSPLDPVKTAVGRDSPGSAGTSREEKKSSSKEEKKKAGFYLTRRLLERFDRIFYELKLEGALSGNKSSLVEAALEMALADIEQGKESLLRRRLEGPEAPPAEQDKAPVSR